MKLPKRKRKFLTENVLAESAMYVERGAVLLNNSSQQHLADVLLDYVVQIRQMSKGIAQSELAEKARESSRIKEGR